MESAASTNFSSASTSADGSGPKTRLVDVPVTNQNEALQLIATFLNLAQKRGAFSLDESAKLWECIKMFQQ
jgi:hypothetical protein